MYRNLANLKVLSIGENDITEIPQEIGKLFLDSYLLISYFSLVSKSKDESDLNLFRPGSEISDSKMVIIILNSSSRLASMCLRIVVSC